MSPDREPLPAIVPTKEMVRSQALHAYAILDTPREQEFDDLAKIAAEVCGTPISIVNFLDTDRQFFKADVGIGERDTPPIGLSFCSHALLAQELLVVPDTTKDERFAANPLVTGEPGIRFYAGALIRTPDGWPIGTVCVLDVVPRELDKSQIRTLKLLAKQAMTQLKFQRAVTDREVVSDQLKIALDASGVIGLWNWNIATDLLHGDANFARLYGLEEDITAAGITMEQYQKHVVPDDLSELRNRIKATMETGVDFQSEYRLEIPGQSLRWVGCKGRIVRDKAGVPYQFSGSAIDITPTKVAEAETRRLAAIVQQSSDFIGVAGLDGRLIMLNEAGRSLVGLDLSEDITGKTISDFFDPAQWPDVTTKVFPALERDGQWRGELSFRHFATGELIPVIYDIIALHDDHGKVTAYATVTRDIRSQKAAEAQQSILNEELSHRMKNTLAMVQAIAMQTLKGVTDRDAVEAFRKRVHAISSAHDVLLRQNWLAAPMGEIVSSVLGTFKLEDRISISGPKVVFGPRATLSLSLLLHELATNAMKYGALSIDGGKVLVSWSIEIIDEIEQIKLEWIEHGGPAVKLPDGKGFGSRLIQMGLSGAGGAQMDYDEAGLRASFSAPLEDVMRA